MQVNTTDLTYLTHLLHIQDTLIINRPTIKLNFLPFLSLMKPDKAMPTQVPKPDVDWMKILSVFLLQ